MTPYYQSDGIAIYHGDCLDVLPAVGGVDVIAADPPYGISDSAMRHTTHGKRIGADNDWHPVSDWDRAINPEWSRAACAAAPVIAWFGHWRKRPTIEAAMAWPLRCEIVWAKDTHVGPPCPVAMQDERIWIFARDGVTPQRFETSVWNVAIIPTWKYKHHKNEKPEALLLRLLSWLPAGRICDPFMGSGTTLVAAQRLGLHAIGIEINERDCETAALRLQQRALPLAECW